MATFSRSILHTLRQFRAAPVFTLTAVLTLALGIGGTTAIFTLINGVMLTSLPVVDPASLYRIGDGDNCCVQGGPQDRWGMFSFPLFERLVEATPEFESVTAFQAGSGRLNVRRENVDQAPRSIRTEYVTGNYFSTLGINAFAGRVFADADDRPSAPPVLVLSYRVWQATYGADPAVVGSTFFVNGNPFTVAGVAPPGFFGETLRASPPEMWIPLQQEPLIAGEGSLLRQPVSAWLRAIGRLKPGQTTDGMGARLTELLRSWMQHDSGYPSNWMPDIIRGLPQQSIAIVPAGAGVGIMKEQYGRSLQILLAVCGLVLLIACANVANLLLARSVAKRGQTAVRLAMGASSRQIVGEALLESVLLAVAGAAAGLLVAAGAARLLLSLAFPTATTIPIDVTPSPIVLAFAAGVALVTGILFGAAPAWFATRTDPIEALRGAGRTIGDHGSFTRRALLVVQATLSVVLVAGSTMLGRSLGNLQGQDFGYAVDGRVLVQLSWPPSTYTPEKKAALYRDLEARLSSLPGIRGAGLALYNPLTDNWGELVLVSGKPLPAPGQQAGASWDRVSAGYLQHLGVTLARGRFFTEADTETTENVAVVNEAFVKRFFKEGEDPLDQHFGLDLPAYVDSYRIVGVVKDAKFAGFALDQPARPMFYVALAQTVKYDNDLMTRIETQSHNVGGVLLVTDLPTGTLEPLLTRTIAAADPELTVQQVRPLREQIERSFDQQRAVAGLAGLFGIVALVLAAVGLYGVTAYSVARRTSEIGIRMALGADRGAVVRIVLAGAFRRVAAGLLLGLPFAVGAGYLLSAQLYGVTFWDPAALAVASGSLAVAAFVASIIPAARAAAIAPIRALRIE